MITQSKYTDHLRSDVLLCNQRRSTRNEQCSDEVGNKESFIFFLEPSECTRSEAFLADESLEFMLSYRHERDLCTSEKCERKNQREKYDKGYGVQGGKYYRINDQWKISMNTSRWMNSVLNRKSSINIWIFSWFANAYILPFSEIRIWSPYIKYILWKNRSEKKHR